jgi:serine/threonine-protein kinase RsbW
MVDNRWIWSKEQHLPSEVASGYPIVQELLQQLERQRWNRHDVFGVHLAVEEALVNAIKHGNRGDPGKRVHVLCQLAEGFVRVEIKDEGEGFDPAAVPDPTADENLENPSGRGIMLMRSFLNIRYNEAGNGVVLEKRRTDRSGRLAAPRAAD